MSEIWELPATVSMLTSAGLALNEIEISDCGISNCLVQFRAHPGLRGSRIGGHISCFYNFNEEG
jgi:hypothetical protein